MYDSQSIRRFYGIDLSRESAPDATTLLHFRRLLEEHELTRAIFEAIKGHLADQGLLLREGTIVDATIIAAPPSTKNRAKAREPEMHQTKKGNAWHFGMDVARVEERSKAQLRAAVKHPFHVVKNLFWHRKVRYRGLPKNTAHLFSLFALANLVLARRLLTPHKGLVRPEYADGAGKTR